MSPHLHPIVRPGRNRSAHAPLINKLLEHLHDTDLWADYLPRIPGGFYLCALLGFGLVIAAAALLRDGQMAPGSIALGLGGLLMWPMVLMGLFVGWRRTASLTLRKQILDCVAWRGDERVLDVGCGNGLLLNGAALRLKAGRAVGLDLWVAHGGGGTLALLWKNARLEKVADRIEFKEADARQMPFASEMFDVVMSNAALHHISRTAADFELALHEMLRVLKPGGQIVVSDVEHLVTACAARMTSAGVKCDVRQTSRFLIYDRGLVVGTKQASSNPAASE